MKYRHIGILENFKKITPDYLNTICGRNNYVITEDQSLIEGLVLDTRKIDLTKYPNLKVISRNGVGLDNIDLDYCKEKNIKVLITECWELSCAVAEHALYLALRLLKSKGELLSNKRLGIIGYGRIGKVLSDILPLDMDWPILYDKLDGSEEENAVRFDELLCTSDVIFVCISGNEQVIGKEELEKMKKGVYIINVAREACVDEDLMIDELILNKKTKILGYASDFGNVQKPSGYYPEHVHNLFFTPHIASLPAKETMEKLCLENLGKGLLE